MKQYYFIVNTKSQTGKSAVLWETIQETLAMKSISYQAFLTEYRGHATKLASQISLLASKYFSETKERTLLVVVGGDGTANEVVNGILDFSVLSVGFIPTGSGNDLGRGLHLSSSPLQCLEDILSSGSDLLMDVGVVSWGKNDSRRFLISAGIGLDADVCRQALTSRLKKLLNKIHLGKLTYVLLTIKTLFSMKTAEVTLTVDPEHILSLHTMIFSAAMNHRFEGGGIPMAPHADAFDGLLSICCVGNIPKWRTFLCLPLLVCARHERIAGFHIINASSATIKTAIPMVVHADGEYCGTLAEIHFSCLPRALSIIH